MADIIIEAKARKQYELPKEGMHQAVLAEVNDLGLQTQTFNGVTEQVPTVQFIWQVEQLDKEGKRILLFERFRKSLGEKANLRKRIVDMFGKEPPLTLNVSKLVGSNAQILVSHVASKKDPSITYANVKAVLKHDPAKPKLEVILIERKKKEEVKTAVQAPSVAGTAVTAASPINDDDIPF
jgi:hypothetical protein